MTFKIKLAKAAPTDYYLDLQLLKRAATVFVMADTGNPLFHVLLSDQDQWVVEVEWPDGTLERIRTFKHHATAADWVATQSQAWLRVQDVFNEQTVSH